jgi:GNAT superfamily N-acetyltransferase
VTATVAARGADLRDLDEIVRLSRQSIAELTPHRGGSVWSRYQAHAEPLEPVLAALIEGAETGSRAVVGTVNEVVVGFGLARLDDLHDGERLAVITDLYVDPEARAIGVGESILDLLIAWARAAGAIGIDALALPGDRATKNFFETFGLTARALVVHRSFADDEAGDRGDTP